MTTADIPKVRILDPKGRVVREGYYFEYPAYMGPGICDGDPKPIPTKRCVMTYDQGDWSMPNTPRFLEVTPPHTIEVIDPAAPSASADASGVAAMRCNMAAMRHAIETAISDLQSKLEMTRGERQFIVRYLKEAIAAPARPATEQEIDTGKAVWCEVCIMDCPNKGKDFLCICERVKKDGVK